MLISKQGSLDNFMAFACHSSMQTKPVNINPQKRLHSKWTAVNPWNKEKHVMVIKLMTPNLETRWIEAVELEAEMTGGKRMMPWRELQHCEMWKQGWLS